MPPDTETPTHRPDNDGFCTACPNSYPCPSATATDLSIPPAAVEAYFVCGCSESGIRAGYRPEALAVVVAAELRRFADQSERELDELIVNVTADRDFDNGVRDALRALRARADQLDPEET